jgi:hypothetical protein
MRRTRSRPRTMLSAVLVVGLLLALGVAPAGATTTRVAISGVQQVLGLDDSSARVWMTGDREHVRDRRAWGVQVDDGLGAGTIEATINLELDHASWEGRAWGTFRSDFGGGGFEGTWRGPINLDPVFGPIGTWTVVARGWGDLAGMQVRGTTVEYLAVGSATYHGMAFSPGDR